jgi:hypothetical protein
MQAVLASIASTIRSGPVTHSGGALDTGPVFAYDARRREVTSDHPSTDGSRSIT